MRRVLQFQLVVSKLARMMGDSGIKYAESFDDAERSNTWSMSGVNNSAVGHEVSGLILLTLDLVFCL